MAPSLHKIIVGLDYGTTYSGVSYVTSDADSLEKIEVINQWPGTSETVSKVPTRIAYLSENPNIHDDTWGYTVTAAMDSYSWTKLLLDRNTVLTDFDDPSLRKLLGSGMMRLPVHKSAHEVCKDFLAGLYQYVVKVLTKKYSEEVFDITAVECWITVPAIWSDAAKEATKSAAIWAGFASRPMDTINIISEPEAAALAAMKPHLNPQVANPIKPGQNILVCDCGGGTVDITTYQILKAHPKLEFKEICVGMGGKVGSTYIDRNFDKWLNDTFGKAYTDIPVKKRGPGSGLMRSFETAKRTFSSEVNDANDAKVIEIEHLFMKAPSCSWFDEDEATLRLTFREMRGFFDPVIKDIVRILNKQADHAKELGHHIDRVILVGGFGDSDYLVQRLRSWCKRRRPRHPLLMCPPQCQSAVVRGAALRGLECLQPSSRIARRHYGYAISKRFRSGVDPEHLSYICDWYGEKFCNNRIHWAVKKGDIIDEDTEAELNLSFTIDDLDQSSKTTRNTIYSCSADEAPEYNSACNIKTLGTVVTKFSGNDYLDAPKRKTYDRGWIRNLKYSIKMKFSAEDGTLVFSTHINGKQVGRTNIEFHND